MTRIYSDMTATDFAAWCERHNVNHHDMTEILGISQTTYFRYWNGNAPITRTVALLCGALDLIHDYESVRACTLTPHDLAEIAADNTKRC